jgi:tungstate transport system substrate-binding protein
MLRLTLALFLFLLVASACGDSNELILATTTSTQDSGLLDVLIPAFEDESGYNVKPIAVGSGQALEMGERGEADVILAHSPKAEEELVAGGFGIERQAVMHNDFVIVGPADDPSGISRSKKASDAFAALAEAEEIFVSRGDESGTHTKELGVWRSAEVDPAGASWYQETGQGMGATLNVANEKRGYTLSDRGTFLSQRDNLDLEILVEGDVALFNPYTVIVVNPEKHSEVNVEGARAFARFLISSQGQELIRTFGVEELGEPLFTPDAFVDSTPAPSRP